MYSWKLISSPLIHARSRYLALKKSVFYSSGGVYIFFDIPPKIYSKHLSCAEYTPFLSTVNYEIFPNIIVHWVVKLATSIFFFFTSIRDESPSPTIRILCDNGSLYSLSVKALILDYVHNIHYSWCGENQ